MPYTNVWTTVAPLDTQAANQGAVDFRATKLDIMQRVASFGAGPIASRPTPETTSATADWTGVMYWTTDTKQVFRWNGSSWSDISANVIGSQIVFISGGGTQAVGTGLFVGYTGVVSANSLGVSGGIEGSFTAELNIASGQTGVVNIAFGSSSTQIISISNRNTSFMVQFTLMNIGTGTQELAVWVTPVDGLTLPVVVLASLSIDTTANQSLSVTMQKSLNGDSISLFNGVAKIL